MTFAPGDSQGQYLNYTLTLPEEDVEVKNALMDSYQQTASAVNNREISIYSLQEIPNGTQYYRNSDPQKYRNANRKLMDFVLLNSGNLAASASFSFPHGIENVLESALIYANCTATTGEIFTLVYPNVWIDATDAFFDNVALILSQCDIVIQILKET